jgi:hypothetical protein
MKRRPSDGSDACRAKQGDDLADRFTVALAQGACGEPRRQQETTYGIDDMELATLARLKRSTALRSLSA